MCGLSWYRGLAERPPPFITPEPPLRTAPLPDLPAYATPNPSLHPDRPAPPMPINFVDGLGYTMNGDALHPADCKVAWERVEKVWGGGEDKVPQFYDVVFDKKAVEQQRADPSLPQRYQSRPSKTEALAGSVFKKLATKLKDKMLDPFASVHPMPLGSVIVSGVESGDLLAHTDTSTAPHVLPPSDWSKLDYHLSTFVALSPQYRLSIQAGTALGDTQVERWDEVLLNQGEVLIMVSTARHHAPPPPRRQRAAQHHPPRPPH